MKQASQTLTQPNTLVVSAYLCAGVAALVSGFWGMARLPFQLLLVLEPPTLLWHVAIQVVCWLLLAGIITAGAVDTLRSARKHGAWVKPSLAYLFVCLGGITYPLLFEHMRSRACEEFRASAATPYAPLAGGQAENAPREQGRKSCEVGR